MNLNSHHTARIFMIVAIIGSILFGNARCMNKETKEILKIFEIGENRDNLSVRNDLNDRYADAMNLTSLANRYNYSDASLRELNDITADMKNLLSTSSLKNINKLAPLNRELTTSFNEVYSDLLTIITKETDKKLLVGLYDDFHSSGNIISHSYYNQAALEYNELVQSFPNNVLSLFNKSQQVSLFGD